MHSLCCCPPEMLVPGFFKSFFTSSQSVERSRLRLTTSSRFFPFPAPVNFKPAATLSYIDIVGKGFGFWKTMPTLLLIITGSMFGSYMFSPSRNTCPDSFALFTNSCILFKVRINVDFPHPDGPIMAVIAFSLSVILMSFRACFAPNQALKFTLCIFTLSNSVSPCKKTSAFARYPNTYVKS